MGETLNCPKCGGEAIPRPAWMGGGIFCSECGVIDEPICDPREATAKIRDLATNMEMPIGVSIHRTSPR